jgi:hypothetical protein
MPEQPAILPVRVAGTMSSRRSTDWAMFATEPDGREVRVRWSLGRSECWRCDDCGPMAKTECAHTLAEQLLGLTRVPELEEAS